MWRRRSLGEVTACAVDAQFRIALDKLYLYRLLLRGLCSSSPSHHDYTCDMGAELAAGWLDGTCVSLFLGTSLRDLQTSIKCKHAISPAVEQGVVPIEVLAQAIEH